MKTDSAKQPLLANNLPLKAITQQDIFHLQETLEQLHSWEQTLNQLNDFFSTTNTPLHKKKIIRDYYANGQIFQLFLRNYLQQTASLNKQIDNLRAKKKIEV